MYMHELGLPWKSTPVIQVEDSCDEVDGLAGPTVGFNYLLWD